MAHATCVVIDGGIICGKPAIGRGMCSKHYNRWWKHGDPLHAPVIIGDDIARFWSKVDRSSGPDACWPWLDKPDPYSGGYGRLHVKGTPRLAHAFSWELARGRSVPAGHEVDHECHNRAIADGTCTRGVCRHRLCCNPTHLVAKLPQKHYADTLVPTNGTHWNTKLTEVMVQEVRWLLGQGMSQSKTAGVLGLGQSTVSRISRNADTISMH